MTGRWKMKRCITTVIILSMLLACFAAFAGCSEPNNLDKYDVSLPVLGEDGWYETLYDDFDGDSLDEEIWTTSPHGLRWESNNSDKPEQACYWCSDMVKVADGKVEIRAEASSSHKCSAGICPSEGRFTSGIETRKVVGDSDKGSSDELLFSQAFGYFEARVKFPDADGLWSAFWLQSSNQRKVSAEGVDGTEIDIYESAFRKSLSSKMGHALIWNGYGEKSKVEDFVVKLEQDLYDGYHTFALKWTPMYYVFYIDGQPTWATDAGGVSHVKEFLRLTVEIDAGDKYGPHGQRIGAFKESAVFYVDYVKVWQNKNYEQYIIDDSQFAGDLDMAN